MARDDEGYRIVSDRSADSLGGHGFPVRFLCDFSGDFAIGCRMAERNFPHDFRNEFFKSGSFDFQGRRKIRSLSRKVDVEPFFGGRENRQVLFGGRCPLERVAIVFLTVEPKIRSTR